MSTTPRKRTVPGNEEPTIGQLLSKALQPEAKWKDKDEFLDVVYWMRQIMGIVAGVIWGILPFKGIIAILGFFAANTLIVHFYFSSYQRVDEDEYGGMAEIQKEGLMTSFTAFLVAWVIFYSALHF